VVQLVTSSWFFILQLFVVCLQKKVTEVQLLTFFKIIHSVHFA